MDPISHLGELVRPVLLGVLVAILATAAWTDLRERRIPNLCSAALLALLPFWVVCFDTPSPWYSAPVACLVLAIPCCALWSRGMLGGGDLKLATASAGFVGVGGLAGFVLLTSLAGGVLATAVWLARRPTLRGSLLLPSPRPASSLPEGVSAGEAPGSPPPVTVPYGIAIALAAAWSVLIPLTTS